jgi:glycosyltransferase involved in cell wall biosynthesis
MTSFDPGGTERQMIELIRRLDRSRWDVHVAGFHERGAWFDRVSRVAPVTVFPVASFRRPSLLWQLSRFARWCRTNRIAVVHTAELPANIFGLPGAALAGVPVRIGNRREINPGKSALQIVLQRLAYACAHKVVANSGAAADRLLLERVAEHKIAVVPNGVDRQPPAPRELRAALRRVIAVANLRPEKGHDVLIDSAVHVLQRFPDARFELVGGGPLLESILARAESRNVARAFDVRGHRDDVADAAPHLRAADAAALPSRSEGMPLALLEAMAAGLPVIASRVGGMLEIVDEGRTGLLVPPDDPRALAERICQLMANPTLATTLGNAARRDVESRYSFDRMVAAFELVYLTELSRRTGEATVAPRSPTHLDSARERSEGVGEETLQPLPSAR